MDEEERKLNKQLQDAPGGTPFIGTPSLKGIKDPVEYSDPNQIYKNRVRGLSTDTAPSAPMGIPTPDQNASIFDKANETPGLKQGMVQFANSQGHVFTNKDTDALYGDATKTQSGQTTGMPSGIPTAGLPAPIGLNTGNGNGTEGLSTTYNALRKSGLSDSDALSRINEIDREKSAAGIHEIGAPTGRGIFGTLIALAKQKADQKRADAQNKELFHQGIEMNKLINDAMAHQNTAAYQNASLGLHGQELGLKRQEFDAGQGMRDATLEHTRAGTEREKATTKAMGEKSTSRDWVIKEHGKGLLKMASEAINPEDKQKYFDQFEEIMSKAEGGQKAGEQPPQGMNKIGTNRKTGRPIYEDAQGNRYEG
jgi:hypothetical protein